MRFNTQSYNSVRNANWRYSHSTVACSQQIHERNHSADRFNVGTAERVCLVSKVDVILPPTDFGPSEKALQMPIIKHRI